MLTRDQMKILFMMRNRNDTIFTQLPSEIFQKILFDVDPNSDVAKVLHHAAYARQEDVITLLNMIGQNPRLLLQAGDVITPGGNEVRRVTVYEFCLGAGDFDLAKMIEPFFIKIPQGDSERLRQFEAYKPHIEGILTQEAYDIKPLIVAFKKAKKNDVIALLNQDMTHQSDLFKAVIQYRKDHGPRIICKPEMHYNYQSLSNAALVLYQEWRNRKLGVEKRNILWRLLGFQMRRLPGVDRCAFAQGISCLMQGNDRLHRSYNLKVPRRIPEFPITLTDDDNNLSGLGGTGVSSYCIDAYGEDTHAYGNLYPSFIERIEDYKEYIKYKIEPYITLTNTSKKRKYGK